MFGDLREYGYIVSDADFWYETYTRKEEEEKDGRVLFDEEGLHFWVPLLVNDEEQALFRKWFADLQQKYASV